MSPRSTIPDHATGEDDAVASLVCWLIARPYRGHRLAKRLLEEAFQKLGERGFRQVEACPIPDRVSYRGSLPLLQEHKFDVVHESERTVTVRREL